MNVDDIKVVSVIGAGLMGHGIAQTCATAGFKVFLRDIEQRFVDNGLSSIKKQLDRMAEKGKISTEKANEIFGRITGVVDLKSAVESADIIIEAITENSTIKNQLWSEINNFAKKEAILASNTSSISITSMATASKRPTNFLGMHFFNPVPVMKLLELIKGHLTSDSVYETVKAFGTKIGKELITVNEAPGFAVNRVLIPFLIEAIRAIEEGVCTPEDMDKGCTLGLNHPMGPLTLLDYVGLDTTLFIADYMFEETGQSRFKAPNLLRKMVRAGLYGRKSGQGFYKY
jgi:3-hydroxybutyryl-CoA dehydrogenase